MPIPSSITVADRAPTPVDHTFVPNAPLNGGIGFVSSDGVRIADKKLGITLRQTGSKLRSRMLLSVPVVVDETINGITQKKVVRSAYAEVLFTFEDTSTTQEQDDLVGMTANLLAAGQTGVIPVVTGRESYF